MRERLLRLTFCFLLSTALLLDRGIASRAQTAAPKGSPTLGGTLKSNSNGLLHFNYVSGRDSETLRMIDDQTRAVAAGDHGTQAQMDNLAIGRTRAQDMINLIKSEELQKALSKVTVKGKQLLQENQEIKNPLMLIAGAASLWYGKTIRLIKGEDFKLSTRIEARGRSGEFSMESPLLNGNLHYDGNGLNISMNRTISSIDSKAELNYNVSNQSFSTNIRHQLAPNLDLTFGASQVPTQSKQTDGRATFEYRFDF